MSVCWQHAGRILTLCVLIVMLLVYAQLRRQAFSFDWSQSRRQSVRAAWSILVGPRTQTGLRLTLRSLYDNVLMYHPRPVLLFYVRVGLPPPPHGCLPQIGPRVPIAQARHHAYVKVSDWEHISSSRYKFDL